MLHISFLVLSFIGRDNKQRVGFISLHLRDEILELKIKMCKSAYE